jgi:hypothetical protein
MYRRVASPITCAHLRNDLRDALSVGLATCQVSLATQSSAFCKLLLLREYYADLGSGAALIA